MFFLFPHHLLHLHLHHHHHHQQQLSGAEVSRIMTNDFVITLVLHIHDLDLGRGGILR